MSTTTEVPRAFIEELARRLPAPGMADVTIEIVGEDIGDQIQVQRLPWHALLYDTTKEVLELSVGGREGGVPVVFRHEIHDPVRVWVEDVQGSVASIAIEQDDGLKTIVRFFERTALGSGS